MIREALQGWRERDTAVVLGENMVSYADLACRASILQTYLPADKMGSIAAVYLPDGSDFLASLFAIFQSGWIALPLNIHLKEKEISDILKGVPVKVVFTVKSMQSFCAEFTKSCCGSPLIFCMEEIMFPKFQPLPSTVPTDPNSAILLLASSGTTGRVKLVCLSEANIDFNVSTYLRHMGYQKYEDTDPRYVLGTPLSGIYGLLVSFSCIARGFPMLPMADHFTLSAFYYAVEKYGISHYDGGTLVASLMDRTLDHPICYDISTLKYFGFGGSKVTAGTLKRLSAAFPKIRFWSGYGMTEASPLIAQPFQELPFEKLDSVGVPLPGVDVYLKTEEGLTDAPNRQGEIVARGPNVMLGYYKDEKATDEIIREGWLHTGDIGYFDEDGYLYICGRKKNMILVRGFNVYPEEVETCLLGCPLVKDCVVYGIESDNGTETVCAKVVPAAEEVSQKAILEWCAVSLADYKCPRHIQIVERLDKTATGKNKLIQEDLRH